MFEPLLSPLFSSLFSPLIAQPIPITQMDLISNLILQRGVGVATFTRSTTGTYIDRITGLVTTAAIDEARFETNGVLIEGASTNEALHNRDFTDVAHVKTNITALKDAVGADGVSNAASTLTATAANGTVFQTVTKASAENTYSIDIRRKTGTGTIEISDDGGVGFTDITSSINNSTYTRFQITSTQANPEFGVRIVTSGDEIEVDYEQLEALPFASSRIETTTTSVTRDVDKLNIQFTGNIPASSADYSWGATVDIFGRTASAGILLRTGDESFRILRAYRNASPFETQIFHDGAAEDLRGGTLAFNTPVRLFGTVDSTTIKIYEDGTEKNSIAKATPVTGVGTSINIGSINGTNPIYGHIKNLKIFDVALTAEQVSNL